MGATRPILRVADACILAKIRRLIDRGQASQAEDMTVLVVKRQK